MGNFHEKATTPYLEISWSNGRVSYCTQWFKWFWRKILRLVLQHRTPFWGRFLFRFHVSLRSLTSRAKHGQTLRYKAAVQGPRTPPPFSWRKGASFPPSFPLAKTPVGEELTYLSDSPKLFFLRFTSSRPYLAVGFRQVQGSEINSTQCGMSLCEIDIYSRKATSDTEANLFSVSLNLLLDTLFSPAQLERFNWQPIPCWVKKSKDLPLLSLEDHLTFL